MNGLLAQAQQAGPQQAAPEQAAPQQPQQGQGRKASPQEQQAYKTLVTQVVGFISKPEITAKLEEMIQQFGPDRALAMVIMQALQMVGEAAKQAGADVATHTGKAAIKEIVTVMTAMLQASGLVEDAQASAQGVMQLIAEGLFGQEQGQGMPQEQGMPPQAGMPQGMPQQQPMGA